MFLGALEFHGSVVNLVPVMIPVQLFDLGLFQFFLGLGAAKFHGVFIPGAFLFGAVFCLAELVQVHDLCHIHEDRDFQRDCQPFWEIGGAIRTPPVHLPYTARAYMRPQ